MPNDEPILDAATMRTFEMRRVSKIAGGRLLDGRTWDEVPSSVAVGTTFFSV
jgi:protein gp37